MNKKILILSHYYNIEDKYISHHITNYLIDNQIIPIFSNNFGYILICVKPGNVFISFINISSVFSFAKKEKTD